MKITLVFFKHLCIWLPNDSHLNTVGFRLHFCLAFYHVYILSLVKLNEFDNTPCDLSYHSMTSGILFVITAEASSHSLQKLEVNILKSLLIDDRKV